MKEISSFSDENCKKLVNKLIVEYYEQFESTSDTDERIKLLYPHLQCLTITPGVYGKSMDDALIEKSKGNSYFVNNDCNNALHCYSAGIMKCPQNTSESCKLLAILVANRSACLYDLKEYEETLNDINYVTHLNVYPEHLKYKLYYREAKCYNYINSKIHLAASSYKSALDYLDLSSLDKSLIQKKKVEIKSAIKALENVKPKDKKLVVDIFKPNPQFPSASSSVMFDYEPSLGRFARAACDIGVGEIIIKESAYCAVLTPEFSLTNCQYCTRSTNAPLPCDKCANVYFCCLECKSAAALYHQYECGLHQTLAESGASINCLMALRMITQSNIAYFKAVLKNLDTSPEVYTFNDYATVYKLCRNEHLRDVKLYFHYTVMAIYLLRLLKVTSYFGIDTREDNLTNNEIFICKLILHNLELLQFNAHEVSELQEAPPGPLDSPNEPNFKAIFMGGGLYPTLALFNHSCDPNIVRYNEGSKVIVKTVKAIKRAKLFLRITGHYTLIPFEVKGRNFLLVNYWFSCTCRACAEDWPLFKDMEDNIIRIPCKNEKCKNFFFLNENIDNPSIKCSSCNSVTNLFPHLKALADLENILFEAEECYKRNNYQKAMEQYEQAMTIYSKHTVPPFPDWVKVQQRLRTCFVSFGNKCCRYAKMKID